MARCRDDRIQRVGICHQEEVKRKVIKIHKYCIFDRWYLFQTKLLTVDPLPARKPLENLLELFICLLVVIRFLSSTPLIFKGEPVSSAWYVKSA